MFIKDGPGHLTYPPTCSDLFGEIPQKNTIPVAWFLSLVSEIVLVVKRTISYSGPTPFMLGMMRVIAPGTTKPKVKNIKM